MGLKHRQFSRQKPQVLVDILPLFSASAFQGIGRYLRELLLAFREMEGELPFTLAGLDTRSPDWQVVELASLEELLAKPPEVSGGSSSRWSRRLAWPTLSRLHCACLHQAEPAQVPITGGIPLVLTYHDLIPLELPKLYSRKAPRLRQALNWTITRWRLFLAWHLVADSQYVARSLVRRFNFPEERITVAYVGVDLRRYHPDPLPNEEVILREKLGLEPGYWLFVGTGDPRKNLRFLLQAVAAANSSVPVVLAGRIDPRQKPLVDEALADSGIKDQVRLLGFVEEAALPTLYRGSLGLLFPSLSEGFGLPVLEAMACGKPALAFSCTALPEVAGDGAWLLPPGDLQAFAEAIRTLERSPAKRYELGQKGRRQAQRFPWRATAEKVATAYLKAMGNGR